MKDKIIDFLIKTGLFDLLLSRKLKLSSSSFLSISGAINQKSFETFDVLMMNDVELAKLGYLRKEWSIRKDKG